MRYYVGRTPPILFMISFIIAAVVLPCVAVLSLVRWIARHVRKEG